MNSLGGVLHGLPCPDSRAERAELLAMLGTLTAVNRIAIYIKLP